jgi:hypothetical protein
LVYRWSDGLTGTEHATHTAGSYAVFGTGNLCQTPTSDTFHLIANEIPDQVTITCSGDTIVQTGEIRTLTASGNFVSYRWSTGDTTASIQASTPGKYTVSGVTATGCQSVDTSIRIRTGSAGLHYRFEQQERVSYDPLSRSITLVNGGNVDSDPVPTINLPFYFRFAGVTYNQVTPSQDGQLYFGNQVSSDPPYRFTSNASLNFVSAFGLDLNSGDQGQLRYFVDGNAPNQILKLEYDHYTVNNYLS